MVTDEQIRRLKKLMQRETTLATAAAKAGMDAKTARKYLWLGKLPSQLKGEHTWQTRAGQEAKVPSIIVTIPAGASSGG